MASQESSARESYPRSPRSEGSWRNWSKLLRAIGLHVVSASSFSLAPTEPAKIAIERSRGTAAFRLLVHVVPFLGAVALLMLNFRGLLVVYTRWYAVLQYVAKAHELLMQASIASVFMIYLRWLFVLDHPAPFGALFSGLSITNIAYLCSPEFVGSCSTPWTTSRRKGTFMLAVVAIVLLAAAVGPSSAVLMLPRPVNMPISTHRSSVNPTTIFPSIVNGTAERTNQRFMSAFMQGGPVSYEVSYNDWVLNWSNDAYMSNATSQSWPSDTYVAFAHVALPMRISADMFDEAMSGRERFEYASTGIPYGAMRSRMPSVATMCTSGQRIDDSSNASAHIDNLFITEKTLLPSGFLTHRELSELMKTVTKRPILWMSTSIISNAPDERLTGFSALAIFISNNTFDRQPHPGLTPFSCMIKASWQEAEINATFTGKWPLRAKFRSHPTPSDRPSNIDEIWDRINPFLWPEPPIKLTTEWLSSLRIRDNLTSTTYDFDTMEAYLRAATAAYDEVSSSRLHSYTHAISVTLSGLIANALSTSRCQYECPELALSDMSAPGDKPTDQTIIHLYVAGVGYTFRNWPSGIAIAILLLYCLMVLGAMMYTFITGVSSSAWDSAAGITALALGSTPPHDLGHISAGLETLDVFRRPVAIMAKNDHLELVFGDGEKAGFCNLEENAEY